MANRSTDPDGTKVAEHERSPEWFGRDPVEWAGELATTWQPEVAR